MRVLPLSCNMQLPGMIQAFCVATGHASLVALPRAEALAWPHASQVYTFAGPRAGNYTFTAYIANCFPGKVFRLVHSSDLVPKVKYILHAAQEGFEAWQWHNASSSARPWTLCT